MGVCSPQRRAGWLSFAGSLMMALPLLAGEASAQPVPRVFWDPLTKSFVEDTQETQNAGFTLTRSLSADLTISYTIGGTATGGVDYRIAGANYGAGTGTFTVPSGTQAWETIHFPIEVISDSVSDNGETIILTFTDGAGYDLGSPGALTVVVTIYEDSGSATFRIRGVPRVGETLTVERISSDPDGDGTFNSLTWQRVDDPASSPDKWRFISSDHSFPSPLVLSRVDEGQYVRSIWVYTDENGLEHVIYTDFVGPILPLGTPEVFFDSDSASARVAEGVGTHHVVVRLRSAPTSDLTLNYSVGGSATAGSDFTISNLGTVQVPAGAISVSIPVSIMEDRMEERMETVILTLEDGEGYLVDSSATTHTLTVIDGVEVGWGTTTVSAVEGEGLRNLALQVNQPRSTPLTVSYTLGGTATPGEDYRIAGANTTTRSGTFTIPAGTPAFTTVDFPIEIMGDSVPDNGETIVVTITAGSDYNPGPGAMATVRIHEESGSAAFRVTGLPRVGNVLMVERTASDPEGEVTLSYQWQRKETLNPGAWQGISGATASTYTPSSADGDKYVRVAVVYTDGNGLPYTIPTDPLGPIAPAGTATASFASASATVAEGMTHQVVVNLSPPSASALTLNYSVRGSATAGSDFTISNLGTVQVPAGAISVSIPVSIMEDRMEESNETVVLTLEAGMGYMVTSSTTSHTLTITDSPAPADGEDHRDHKRVKKAWHLRLGRTLSHQVADGLQDRLSVPPAAGPQLTVAGEAITSAVPLAEQEGLLTKALGFEAVTSQALAAGSSFRVASGQDPEGAAPRLAFWGQGAFSSFSGEEEDLSLDGEVTTLLLGADWTSQRWRAGAALSQSWGSGSYDGDNSAEGEISTTVTGVFPYGRYALTPRLGIWATAGYGWGELSFQPDGEDEFTPSTTMSMAAVGMDGLVRDGGSDGISLTTTADLLMVKTHSEEVDGLESSEGSLSRLRLGLEAVRPFPLSDGASLLPTMALGIRQDDGDAETGFGLELGAGLLWMAPERGLSGALQGHTLLTHGEEDLQEQGLAFSFSWEPSPSNRGPSLSLNHTMGATPSPGMDARNPTTHPNSGQQFEAELAYGLPAHSDRLSLTPAVALALSPTSRTYSLLWSLAPYAQQAHPDPWQLSLAGERQEPNTATAPMDHSLKLRFSTLF